MSHRHILYVAYGADCYVQEAAYSILSLWRLPDGESYQITVVTDRGDALCRWLGVAGRVVILPLSEEQIRQWRGEQGYVHRAKPLAIQWAVATVAAEEDLVLFVDSDTVFMRSPAPLFDVVAQGAVVLNELEGLLAESRSRTRSHGKLYRASRRLVFKGRERGWHLAGDTQLWNSGVIGFRYAQLEVFEETVALIDAMYAEVPIQTIEQVALSMVLQDRGIALQDSGDRVFHYHGFKEFRQDLARFFERYANEPVEQRLMHWPEVDPVLRAQPKQAFNRRPKWLRQVLKRLGMGWKPLPYPWK